MQEKRSIMGLEDSTPKWDEYRYTPVEWQNGSGPAINKENLSKSEEALELILGLKGSTEPGLLQSIYTALGNNISNLNKDLDSAKKDLETKIAAQIDPTELAEEIKEVTDIIDALDDIYATDAKLAEAITKAENELEAAVSTLETNLGEEVTKLQNQITSNDTDIAEIKTQITTVNSLIDALEAADVTLDGKITDAINKAKSELDSAVATLETKLENELNNAIKYTDEIIIDCGSAPTT